MKDVISKAIKKKKVMDGEVEDSAETVEDDGMEEKNHDMPDKHNMMKFDLKIQNSKNLDKELGGKLAAEVGHETNKVATENVGSDIVNKLEELRKSNPEEYKKKLKMLQSW